MEQEMFTLPKQLSLSLNFSMVHVVQSLVFSVLSRPLFVLLFSVILGVKPLIHQSVPFQEKGSFHFVAL
jgi:hypothetical protein